MRGRKPDNPAIQAAKGNPGRRSRGKKAAPGKRAAELAAVPAVDGGALSPPNYLAADPNLRAALEIWREHVPELRRLNLLDHLDRHTFAMYCVHMADWIEAVKDIAANGNSYIATNVNGDDLIRLNPSIKARELAAKHILDIGARFGLDPSSRFKLLRDQSAAPLGGLFGGAGAKGGEAPEPERGSEGAPGGEIDPVGLLRREGASGPARMQ